MLKTHLGFYVSGKKLKNILIMLYIKYFNIKKNIIEVKNLLK